MLTYQVMQTANIIPLNIWSYWEGPNNKYIDICYKSWLKHCPNYNIVVLNSKNLIKYLPEIRFNNFKHKDSQARISDYVRFNILVKYGGIWLDATIIITRPLIWVENYKTEFVGYWRQASTTSKKYKVVESWFLACSRNNKFMRLWRDEFMRINNYKTVREYISSISRQKVDLQNIGNLIYLACYVACQCVIQKQISYEEYEKLTLIRMEDTARYLDSVKVHLRLATDPIEMLPNIIKFTQWNRRLIDTTPSFQKILDRFNEN